MMTKSAADGAVHRRQHQSSPQKVPPPPPPNQRKRAAPELPPATVADVPPLPSVPPPTKFRKRMSSCYSHMNVRDPLNLGSVKPDNPDDPNFAKPIQLIPTNVNDPLNLQNLSASPGGTPTEAAGQKRKRKRIRTTQAAAPRDESADEQPTTSDDLSPPPSAAAASATFGARRFTWKRATATTMTTVSLADTLGDDNAVGDVVAAKTSMEMAMGDDASLQPSTSSTAAVAAAERVAEAEKEAEEARAEKTAAAEARWERRRKMAERYRYGNFNHYQLRREFRLAAEGAAFLYPQHQYQQQQQLALNQAVDDPRVRFFCPDWFQDKCVLDIGSNAGHFAISLARAFQPRRMVGVDIDQHLVGAARKNIRHFCDKDTKMAGKFPASFAANFGPISAPSTSNCAHFPDNVWFFCENYVLPTDSALDKVHEEFDIIFALGCSKWVHLNWGDTGIKRFFLRAFRQLRTGGRFVLETAPFKDYRKHCKRPAADRPPEEVLKNFGAIRFHPDEFTAFLLSTVGFSHHEELDSVHSKALGISGRLQVFYKGQFMLITTNNGNNDAMGERGDDHAGVAVGDGAAMETGQDNAGVAVEDDAPGEAGQDDAPGEAGQDDAPGEAGQDDAPGEAGQDDAPGEAAQDDAPGEAAQDDAGTSAMGGRLQSDDD